MSKWRAFPSLQISGGSACLWPLRHPAYSGHELGPGYGMERENPVGDAKRKPYKRSPRRGKVAMHQQGADRPVLVRKGV
jgi:hypothetical protein